MVIEQEASLLISELFYSIQGESSFAGYPCTFIRLAGCNLRCSYCDAKYTYEEKGRTMTVQEVFDFTRTKPASLIQITGGEPLLQEQVYPLMADLLADDRLILLETNGSVSLKQVPAGVIKIMDIKCPGSGMEEAMLLPNLELLSPRDELKFVLSSREDYDWAVEFLKTHVLFCEIHGEQQRRPKVLFSPVHGRLAAKELAHWLLEDQLPIRLQLQLHTILWPEIKRGI